PHHSAPYSSSVCLLATMTPPSCFLRVCSVAHRSASSFRRKRFRNDLVPRPPTLPLTSHLVAPLLVRTFLIVIASERKRSRGSWRCEQVAQLWERQRRRSFDSDSSALHPAVEVNDTVELLLPGSERRSLPDKLFTLTSLY